MSHMEFWRSWFGIPGGREVGSPYRSYIQDAEAFLTFIEDCSKFRLPCYMSVQSYSATNTPCTLEKLFFNFDCKADPEKAIAEARDFADKLERFYGAMALLVFSGAKGCHVYVWLHVLEFLPKHVLLVKETYRRLQLKLLKGLHYETVDMAVIGDLARLSRVPYTLHEKSGRICKPIQDVDLEAYRKNGLSDQFLRLTLQEAKLVLEVQEGRRNLAVPFKSVKGVRKQVQFLIDKAQRGESLEHGERLAVTFELIAAGKTDDEIASVFSGQKDYGDGSKTRYFIEHARKRRYKPFRTETLRRVIEL